MTKRVEFELPRAGAKALEGIANGCPISLMSKAIGGETLPSDTLKYYMRVAYSGLYIPPRLRPRLRGAAYGSPTGLAVGMSLAAGLLQAKDLQRPGEDLAFTMTPPQPESPIRYVDTHDRYGTPHVWPDQPLCRVKIPQGIPPDQPETMELDGAIRSFLAATLLGMSIDAIAAKGLCYYSKSSLDRRRRCAGFGTSIQFAAHCVAQNIIEVPEEVLRPTSTLKAIKYSRSALLTLPPGVVYDEPIPPISPPDMGVSIPPPCADSV